MMPILTRRSVLKVAGFAGGAAAAVASSSPAQAGVEPVDTKLTWRDDELCESIFFSEDWTTRYASSFPRAIRFAESDEPRKLVAQWDARLYEVEALAQLDSNDDGALTNTFVRGNETGSAALTVPAGASSVLFRVSPLNLFPSENIGIAREVSFQLQSVDGTVVAERTVFARSREASPWGVRVEVSWICRDGQIAPGLVEVRSTGPSPVPAGTTIVLRSAGVEGSFTAFIDGDPEKPITGAPEGESAGLLARGFALVDPLARDGALLISNSEERSDSVPADFGASTPSVTIRLKDGESDLRQVGSLSTFPITRSGSPISTFEPSPTVLNKATEKE